MIARFEDGLYKRLIKIEIILSSGKEINGYVLDNVFKMLYVHINLNKKYKTNEISDGINNEIMKFTVFDSPNYPKKWSGIILDTRYIVCLKSTQIVPGFQYRKEVKNDNTWQVITLSNEQMAQEKKEKELAEQNEKENEEFLDEMIKEQLANQ